MRYSGFIGMVGDEDVAVADTVIAVQLQDTSHQVAVDRRVKEHRRRDDEPPATIEDHTGEVTRLADDGGVAGAIEMIVHLLDQAENLVAQNLDEDGVHGYARSRIKLRSPSTRALQPTGMTVVASNCSTTAGPTTVAPTSRRSRS